MRAVDADELIKTLSSKDLITWTHEYGDAIPCDWLMSAIDNAPTVEPRWIPTSEMLPERYDSYLVMWRRRDEYSDSLFYEIVEYFPADDEGEGEWEQIEQAGKDGAEIVAWMPLPEMYEPKEAKHETD